MSIEEPARERRVTRPAAVVIGALAALLYANFLLDWVLRDFSGMSKIVSELEAPGQPNATLLRVTDVICAALVVSLLPWVRSALPAGRWRELAVWAMVVFAICATTAAVIAAPCGPGAVCDEPGQRLRTVLHDGNSIVSDTAFFASVAATWFSIRASGPGWLRGVAWWDFWLGGMLASLAFGYLDLLTDAPEPVVGFGQRVHILGISLWIATLGVFAGTRGLRASPPPEAPATEWGSAP